MSYRAQPDSHSTDKTKVELDLSNYSKKSNSKNVPGVTSKSAKKVGLASLKSKFDALDIDKLKTVPTDLSKLSDLVNYSVFKKTVYYKLVGKNNITDAVNISELL